MYNQTKNWQKEGIGMDTCLKDACGKYFQPVRKEMGDLSAVKAKGMHFEMESYEVKGAGSLCLISMKGMAGLMKMESASFTPSCLDGPILSTDRIHLPWKEILLIEIYRTTLTEQPFAELDAVRARYGRLPSYTPAESWYSGLLLPVSAYYRGGRGIRDELDRFSREYCEAYIDLLAACPACDPAEKARANAVLPEGLLKNGGPAVNQFKAMIGEEKTAEFIRKYMFCCE